DAHGVVRQLVLRHEAGDPLGAAGGHQLDGVVAGILAAQPVLGVRRGAGGRGGPLCRLPGGCRRGIGCRCRWRRYRRGSAGGGAVVGGGGGRRGREGRGQVAGGAGGGAPRQAVGVELRYLLAVDQLPGLGVAVARRLVEVVHGAVPVLGHTLALVVLDGEVELGVGGAVVG